MSPETSPWSTRFPPYLTGVVHQSTGGPPCGNCSGQHGWQMEEGHANMEGCSSGLTICIV